MCDAIEHMLRSVEIIIRGSKSDIQALEDGEYHQVEPLQRRYAFCVVLKAHSCIDELHLDVTLRVSDLGFLSVSFACNSIEWRNNNVVEI